MFQCSSCSGLQSARPLAKAPPFGRETAAAEGGAWDGLGWVEWAERDGSREAERDGSGERSCDGGGGGGDSCRGGSGGRAAGSGKDPKPSGSQCSSATWRVPPPSPLRPCSTTVSVAMQLRATTASTRACATMFAGTHSVHARSPLRPPQTGANRARVSLIARNTKASPLKLRPLRIKQTCALCWRNPAWTTTLLVEPARLSHG